MKLACVFWHFTLFCLIDVPICSRDASSNNLQRKESWKSEEKMSKSVDQLEVSLNDRKGKRRGKSREWVHSRKPASSSSCSLWLTVTFEVVVKFPFHSACLRNGEEKSSLFVFSGFLSYVERSDDLPPRLPPVHSDRNTHDSQSDSLMSRLWAASCSFRSSCFLVAGLKLVPLSATTWLDASPRFVFLPTSPSPLCTLCTNQTSLNIHQTRLHRHVITKLSSQTQREEERKSFHFPAD